MRCNWSDPIIVDMSSQETDGDSSPRTDKAVLYLHGVKGTRARTYRVGVYNILLKLGFRVQTILPM